MSAAIVTKLLGAADNYDLVTLDVVKDELQIQLSDTSRDDFLGRTITQVSTLVQNYVKRPFAIETIEDAIYLRRFPYGHSWRHRSPSGVAPLQLSRWPVVNVSSVQQAGASGPVALIEDQDFAVDAKPGLLLRLDPLTGAARNWEPFDVVVVYDAGYDDVPADVVADALRLIVGRFEGRKRDPLLLESVQPGFGTQRWWVGGPKGGGTLPAEVQGMLDLYRVPQTG
jgi:hypothetical protein